MMTWSGAPATARSVAAPMRKLCHVKLQASRVRSVAVIQVARALVKCSLSGGVPSGKANNAEPSPAGRSRRAATGHRLSPGRAGRCIGHVPHTVACWSAFVPGGKMTTCRAEISTCATVKDMASAHRMPVKCKITARARRSGRTRGCGLPRAGEGVSRRGRRKDEVHCGGRVRRRTVSNGGRDVRFGKVGDNCGHPLAVQRWEERKHDCGDGVAACARGLAALCPQARKGGPGARLVAVSRVLVPLRRRGS